MHVKAENWQEPHRDGAARSAIGLQRRLGGANAEGRASGGKSTSRSSETESQEDLAGEHDRSLTRALQLRSSFGLGCRFLLVVRQIA